MPLAPPKRNYGSQKTYGSSSHARKRPRLGLLSDLPSSEPALDDSADTTGSSVTASEGTEPFERASTPPTTPGADDDNISRVSDSPYALRAKTRAPTLTGNLDAFFAPASSSSRTITTKAKKSTTAKGKEVKPKLEQLQLDLSNRPRTASCAECGMAFVRGAEEDTSVHDRHHKRVVGGVDYAGWKSDLIADTDIDCGEGDDTGRIVIVPANVIGQQAKKVNEILATIDTELSSTSLSPTDLAQAKLFFLVSGQRKKVLACAVAAPITAGYPVIPAPSASAVDQERSIRFGEDDSSATFCSATTKPARVGIHRIWTSRSARRHGLATLLLDAVCARFIYASHVSKDRVAFSQPTGAGAALAKRWTGKQHGWLVWEG